MCLVNLNFSLLSLRTLLYNDREKSPNRLRCLFLSGCYNQILSWPCPISRLSCVWDYHPVNSFTLEYIVCLGGTVLTRSLTQLQDHFGISLQDSSEVVRAAFLPRPCRICNTSFAQSKRTTSYTLRLAYRYDIIIYHESYLVSSYHKRLLFKRVDVHTWDWPEMMTCEYSDRENLQIITKWNCLNDVCDSTLALNNVHI